MLFYCLQITHLRAYNVFMPKHALVANINRSGSKVGSLHDPGAVRIGAVSEAFEFIGTFFHRTRPVNFVICKCANS
jgi:hypothetical protein